MKIFFDYQIFAQQLYGGISRYFCELITGINRTSNNAHLSLLYSNNAHLHEYELDIMPYYFPKRHRFLRTTNRYFNIIDLKLNNFDIYHPTYFNPFFVEHIGQKPYVVTYYDMIYEKFGHRFETLNADKNIVKWKRDISKGAAGLIAISESTKEDMVNYLQVSPDRIHVIYLSSSLGINLYDTLRSDNNERPYLLYVGNRDIYKNFMPFLVAVSPILKKYDLALICAGGGSFNAEEIKIIVSYGLKDYVKQFSITDHTLPKLYNQAVAFIFPSLYEGFGIPILESMSCNCPCILSNCSSMPEIAGEAAMYFDPDDVDDMRSAIIKVVDDKMHRKKLAELGLNRASAFSWERTVKETLTLYNNILSIEK